MSANIEMLIKQNQSNMFTDISKRYTEILDHINTISTTDDRIPEQAAGPYTIGDIIDNSNGINGTGGVTGIGDLSILDQIRRANGETNFFPIKSDPQPYTSNGHQIPIEYSIILTMPQLAKEILAGDYSRVNSKNLLAMLVAMKQFQDAINKAKEHLGLDF